MKETLTLQLAPDGTPPREIALRRPTRGELDVALLSLLSRNFSRLWRRRAEIEESAEPGAAVKSATTLGLLDETGEEIARRVGKCLTACAPPDAIAWLDGLSALDRLLAVMAIAEQLVEKLVPVAKLPK